MRNTCCQRNRHQNFRALLLIAGAVLELGFARPSLAKLAYPTFSVEPSLPSTYEPTALRIEGISTDGCLPEVASVTVATHSIDVTIYEPGFLRVCPAVVLPWSARVDLGLLEVGNYTVTVRTVQIPPPQLSPSQVIGWVEFSVGDRVGAIPQGLDLQRIVCKNFSTGQRVITRGTQSQANCEAAGLVVHTGDDIGIRIFGSVP